MLDLSIVDLVKAELFDQALTPLDEKVTGRVLKYATSCTTNVQGHFNAMVELHRVLTSSGSKVVLEVVSKKRKLEFLPAITIPLASSRSQSEFQPTMKISSPLFPFPLPPSISTSLPYVAELPKFPAPSVGSVTPRKEDENFQKKFDHY